MSGVPPTRLNSTPQEKFVILHKRHGQGDDFRLLGSWVDVCFSMGLNISKIIARARPKVIALLRTKLFYTTSGMITQCKALVFCILELNTRSFYYTFTSVWAEVAADSGSW